MEQRKYDEILWLVEHCDNKIELMLMREALKEFADNFSDEDVKEQMELCFKRIKERMGDKNVPFNN
ncbi:MAG: hypothetical protein LBC06_01145 [Rickettsiales bacterium]|jgi:hypothetical protein|nr:hypothetical protein [Rickettsiales bacterium]